MCRSPAWRVFFSRSNGHCKLARREWKGETNADYSDRLIPAAYFLWVRVPSDRLQLNIQHIYMKGVLICLSSSPEEKKKQMTASSNNKLYSYITVSVVCVCVCVFTMSHSYFLCATCNAKSSNLYWSWLDDVCLMDHHAASVAHQLPSWIMDLTAFSLRALSRTTILLRRKKNINDKSKPHTHEISCSVPRESARFSLADENNKNMEFWRRTAPGGEP